MFKRILVPVDGSATSNLALDAAIDLALTCGGRLRVVHALDEPKWFPADGLRGRASAGRHEDMCHSGDDLLHKSMEKARSAGLEADMMLLDKPGVRLSEAVANATKLWDADLVVLGSHGRKGFHRWVMGSGAEQVIRQAPVPVLVIRGKSPPPSKAPARNGV